MKMFFLFSIAHSKAIASNKVRIEDKFLKAEG